MLNERKITKIVKKIVMAFIVILLFLATFTDVVEEFLTNKTEDIYKTNFISQAFAQSSQPLLVPGLVLGLRHNMNNERDIQNPNKFMVFFSAPRGAPVTRLHGGDLGAPLHRGYEWWMINDSQSANPNSFNLPPGVVLALKHNKNQRDMKNITLFGKDPVTGPDRLSNFVKYHGGDIGKGSAKGDGFYWYESTWDKSNSEVFCNWDLIAKLPKWTIIGLKHSKNQPSKTLKWCGTSYDPADAKSPVPPGFRRVSGGDIGAHAGEGYYWYEKTNGPEIVTIPDLTVKLKRNLFISPSDTKDMDRDRDGLIDFLEGELASTFSPYLIFDSNEKSRKPHEPVVLFQVRPIIKTSPQKIGIKWVFLFEEDKGYGPASHCKDDHKGDNDEAYFELISKDNGYTWTIERIILSFRGLSWPVNSRLEVHELTHPIIYMSAHKHHMYFTRDYDQKNSIYSDWGCNDNVDGKGFRIIADVKLFSRFNSQIQFNNVGEPESHPSPPFVDDLSIFYKDHSAWKNKKFYDCDPISSKWLPRWTPPK